MRDGGVDYYVERKPEETKGAAARYEPNLTRDLPGNIVVSCKSGKDSRTLTMTDARTKPIITDVLQAGGSYLVLANDVLGALKSIDLENQVTAELAKRLAVEPDSIRAQVAVCTAFDLIEFLNWHPISLPKTMQQVMGIHELNGLQSVDDWARSLERERGLPDFVLDNSRRTTAEAIRAELEASEPGGVRSVIWVHGPPGVGKSRIVMEALQHSRHQGRNAFVAPDVGLGRELVRGPLARTSGVVLVLDECPPSDALGLRTAFFDAAPAEPGLLVLVGPRPAREQIGSFDARFDLVPLDDEASARLISGELGLPEAELIVQRILRLTGGFPWFAVLVSRAVSEDHEQLLIDPSQLNAADLAIGGATKDYASDNERREVVKLRKQALLAVILTEGLDWNYLGDVEERLARVLEVSWAQIREQAIQCEQRGILREQLDWRYRYVTPDHLAKIVAEDLLAPPSGLAGRIRAEVPELLESFQRRLTNLEVVPDRLAQLAEVEVLGEPERPFDVVESARLGTLTFLARHHPFHVGTAIHSLVSTVSPGFLESRDFPRRNIIFALAHISRRKGGFDYSEPSLFLLAVHENETYANNATGIWASLFNGVFTLTHEPFARRLARLVERLDNGPVEHRLVALDGLDHATASHGALQGYSEDDLVDGEWPKPTYEAIKDNKVAAWGPLMGLTAETGEVGLKARGIASRNFLAMIRWNAGATAAISLAEVASNWPPEQKAALREHTAEIRRYEGDFLEAGDGLGSAIGVLDLAISATTFHDHLVDIVGSWHPGRESITAANRRASEEALDAALIAQALDDPSLLTAEFEWIDSESAVRSQPFMFHLGGADKYRVFLPILAASMPNGPGWTALPAYLVGMANSDGIDAVDDVLRGWRGDPAFALATLGTIQRVGATSERIVWVSEDLSKGSIDPSHLGTLSLGGWGEEVSLEALRPLLLELARFDELSAEVTAFNLILEGRQEPVTSEWLTLACELANRIAAKNPPSISEHVWERGCLKLIDLGQAHHVAIAAATAIRASELNFANDSAWRIAVATLQAMPHEAWNIIADVFDPTADNAFAHALEASRTNVLEAAQTEDVIGWVGDNEDRAVFLSEMARVHQRELSPTIRMLITKFGAEGPFGRALFGRAISTPDVITGGFAAFYESQFQNAEQWRLYPESEVGEWSTELMNYLKPTIEKERAREEFREREWRR